MVRKQLYITADQDRALKRRSRSTGLSEAEIVRRALDESLSEKPEGVGTLPEAVQQLIDHTRRLSLSHKFPDEYRFDRSELYER